MDYESISFLQESFDDAAARLKWTHPDIPERALNAINIVRALQDPILKREIMIESVMCVFKSAGVAVSRDKIASVYDSLKFHPFIKQQ